MQADLLIKGSIQQQKWKNRRKKKKMNRKNKFPAYRIVSKQTVWNRNALNATKNSIYSLSKGNAWPVSSTVRLFCRSSLENLTESIPMYIFYSLYIWNHQKCQILVQLLSSDAKISSFINQILHDHKPILLMAMFIRFSSPSCAMYSLFRYSKRWLRSLNMVNTCCFFVSILLR